MFCLFFCFAFVPHLAYVATYSLLCVIFHLTLLLLTVCHPSPCATPICAICNLVLVLLIMVRHLALLLFDVVRHFTLFLFVVVHHFVLLLLVMFHHLALLLFAMVCRLTLLFLVVVYRLVLLLLVVVCRLVLLRSHPLDALLITPCYFVVGDESAHTKSMFHKSILQHWPTINLYVQNMPRMASNALECAIRSDGDATSWNPPSTRRTSIDIAF